MSSAAPKDDNSGGRRDEMGLGLFSIRAAAAAVVISLKTTEMKFGSSVDGDLRGYDSIEPTKRGAESRLYYK